MSATAGMESRIARWHGRTHAVALGSGTWAIALLLRALAAKMPNRRVALPDFLCHNPLAAVVHADWRPHLVDVEVDSGVPSAAAWRRALDTGVDALLWVHLFGNPEAPAGLLAECRERGVFVIEDACQALGAAAGGAPCGSFGDAAVISFGHTKLVDAGAGGMLLTDDAALAAQVRAAAAQHVYAAPATIEAEQAAFSREFYAAKAGLEAAPPARAGLGALVERFQPLVPRAWPDQAEDRIDAGLAALPRLVAERRRKAARYRAGLEGTGAVAVGMHSDSVPWRYCFRVPGLERARRDEMAAAMRARGINVSSWYLPTHWLHAPLAADPGFPGCERLSAEVFQFWLDEYTGDAGIDAAVHAWREVAR